MAGHYIVISPLSTFATLFEIMHKFKPILYFSAAALLTLIVIACVISIIQALLIPDTVSAIESAIGTGVIAMILAVVATKLYQAGRRQLRAEIPEN